MASTRIIKEVSYFEFRELIDSCKGRIRVSSHACFRLSQMQRKVYKDDTLVRTLTEEKPAFIGLQQNQNYAAFFSKKESYLKLIFKVIGQQIEIITFYVTEHIPWKK